ncbi:Cob(I)alamin adenosyltransferase [Dehalococcoides mccartyi]|uniref:Cob(I)alamin adenosyltransferase n=1 Tax=Dehalococcoides mccartyi TaxID=61435 RepID=A0A328EKU4_9CHLR|nr:Cob(I)alamin adenosyltransferase [Dehalococcoides mccartyi]RAL70479.1 Cob(I)alamin adenosyltransferase [Dehalococcoides mccartyi]
MNSTQHINKYNTGLVQIFTGDGRGKTSAALVQSCGHPDMG